MKRATNTVEELTRREYKYGFVSDIESDSIPAGLNEDVIRVISAKKHEPDFMLDWRLKAYRYWASSRRAGPRGGSWRSRRESRSGQTSIILRSTTKKSFITRRQRRKTIGPRVSKKWTRSC